MNDSYLSLAESQPVFKMSLDVYCIIGFDGNFQHLGTMWQQILGYSTEQLLNQPIVELIHPDDRQSSMEILGTVPETKHRVEFENRCCTNTGEYRRLFWNCTADTEKKQIYAIVQDITDKTTTQTPVSEPEQAIHRIRDHLLWMQNLAELKTILEIHVLTELNLLGIAVDYVSVQVATSNVNFFLDYRRIIAIDRGIPDQIPLSQCPWVSEAWQSGQPVIVPADRLQDHGYGHLKTIIEIPTTGGSLAVSSKSKSLNPEAVQVIQPFADLINIPALANRAKMQLSQQLALSEERIHRSVLEMEHFEDYEQVIHLLDRELKNQGLNFDAIGLNTIDEKERTLTSYTVFSDGEFIHRVNSLEQKTNQQLLTYWQQGKVWERAPEIDMKEFFPNSDYNPKLIIDIPFSHGTVVVGLKSKKEYNTLLINHIQHFCPLLGLGYRRAQDLILRQQAEDQLVQAKVDAEQASKSKSIFLANMSHEIRTPMNAIMGLTELMLETELNTAQREYLENVKLSADNLLALLNDVLDLSRAEAGNITLENTKFKPYQIVQDVTKTLSIMAQKKGIELIHQIKSNVPEYLFGDSLRLHQVLINLLSNAIKFTEQGRVFLFLETEKVDARQTLVKFTVKDTGIGIPQDKQTSIFNMFTQINPNANRQYGGTGLGLAIVTQLVQVMGGRIWVDSTEGKGSTFSFTAPFGVAETTTGDNLHVEPA